MIKGQIIKKTAGYVKKVFKNDSTGHDWWHIYRVWQTAQRIAKEEKANMFIVQMAVLLHDLGDYKLEPDRKDRQVEKVGAWLKKMNVDPKDKSNILDIITNMSYSKNLFQRQELSLEGKVVQDADRLDAIGSIGIMRSFVYAGAHKIPPYNPAIKPRVFKNMKGYKKHEASSINHFYEKLLLLKDQLNTKTAKKIAAGRHAYMEKFLEQFFNEWEGKK